jgi:hypothetical protein
MRIYDESTGSEGRLRVVAHEARDTGQAGLAGLPALVASRTADPSAVLDLQRAAGNGAVAQLLADDEGERSPVLDVVGRGGGQPLAPKTRMAMEGALGADFSGVRVHTDAAASASAQAVQAHAYTVGSDVVFQSGKYEPETPSGQRMLAHELTHVVQQRSGPVDATPTGAGISVSHPSDSYERAAEASADRFMAGGGMAAHGAPVGAPPSTTGIQRDAEVKEPVLQGGAFVQRQDEEQEEESVQGAFVQRQGDEEEEMEAPVAG